MANEQQAVLPVSCSVESSLSDMVPLDRPRVLHKAVKMDDSPGRLSAPDCRHSITLSYRPVLSYP